MVDRSAIESVVKDPIWNFWQQINYFQGNLVPRDFPIKIPGGRHMECAYYFDAVLGGRSSTKGGRVSCLPWICEGYHKKMV